MLKWTRYAEGVLRQWFGGAANSFNFNQAVLQHYGWRSFYIDVTSSEAVASWFACHEYHDRVIGEMCEDCDERPVILCKKMAEYAFNDGFGHLYVIDPAIAARTSGMVDLSILRLDKYRPRFDAQSAWLLGPFSNKPIDPACYLGHIVAKRGALKSYAEESGFIKSTDLFPGRSEDPVLASLLDLPWRETGKRTGQKDEIPIFHRTIDIQEYCKSYQKILPSHIALYRNAQVADIKSVDGTPENNIVIRVPSSVIFGSVKDAPNRFPLIISLLEKYTCVTFEIDDIIRYPSQDGKLLYVKGLSVMNRENHLIEVGDLMVEHPGMSLTRAGHLIGWYYEVTADGIWTRTHHCNECPCGNDHRHLGHISALHIIEHFLSQPNEVD